MRKARLLPLPLSSEPAEHPQSPPTPDKKSWHWHGSAMPSQLATEPDSETAFAVALYRYSRWPDLKARYHCAFEFDPQRMRQPPDEDVVHGED